MAKGWTVVAFLGVAVGCAAVAPPDGGGGGGGASGCSGMQAKMNDDSYFVAGSFGNDAAQGTSDQPLASIQTGIDLADQSGGGDVYVAGGVYAESLTLRSNVYIYGGFDRTTWTQCADQNPTSIIGGSTAVIGYGVSGVKINGFTIVSSEESGGGSSIAIQLANASDV